MKEFIEKLIERLREKKNKWWLDNSDYGNGIWNGLDYAEKIVNQLAEEYKTSFMDELLEAKRNCGEDSDCSECPFGQIEDRCVLQELQTERENNGWIPCSESLPEENQHVLGCFAHGLVIELGFWNGLFHGIYEYNTNVIIAWQPLPTPFQPKGE